MRTIIQVLLIAMIITLTSLFSIAFADDDVVKFKLEIKPNQQKVEAKVDGDEHKQIQIRAEYIKLNTITNNYHIKVIITNNSGQVLYHQIALIDKVEYADVKYPDGITDYVKIDDGKQITKTLPYYNYGNIKSNQATPREWYLSNTGKDEIEVKGYIINKEIPVVLDPKIAAMNADVAMIFTQYLQALRDNDIDSVLKLLAKPDQRIMKDLPSKFNKAYSLDKSSLLKIYPTYQNIKNIVIYGNICEIKYEWIDINDGNKYLSTFVEQNGGNNIGWVITKN